MVSSWKQTAASMVTSAETYERSVRNPGGQPWTGATATAAIDMAGQDLSAVKNMRTAIDAMADAATNSINNPVIPNLNDVRAKIADAEAAGFTVGDDLSVTFQDSRPPDVKKKEDAERRATEIQNAATKWWTSDQAVADQITRDKAGLAVNFSALGGLNAAEGRGDGTSLLDGKLSADELARLLAAGHLSDEQLAALARGEDITVGPQRLAYLYQLAQGLDGMTPEQIKALQGQLPPDAQAALAQGMAILSNPHAKSGVPNNEGATEDTQDTFIPAAGSLGNLPDGIVKELTRTDRVTKDTPSLGERIFAGTVGTVLGGDPMVPTVTNLNGVGALEDIAELFKPADDGYTNGSEASKAMLSASSEYANAIADYSESIATTADVQRLESDAHGDLTTGLANAIQVGATDHVGVHDLATGENRDDFLRAMSQHTWGDQSDKIGDAFRWMDDDQSNRINTETASSVAHYVADHSQELRDLPGKNSAIFGDENPGVSQAIAEGLSPYLDELAGAHADGNHGIDPFQHRGTHEDGTENGVAGMADLFEVLDRDHQSAVTINAAGAEAFQGILENAAAPGPDGVELQAAGRLESAMKHGAELSDLFDTETARWQDAVDSGNQKGWNDTVISALEKVPGLGDPLSFLKMVQGIPDGGGANPALIQGDGFVEHLTSLGAVDNATAFHASVLRGLIEHDPTIADDPELKPLTTDGQLDPAKVANPDNVAGATLTRWFENTANPGRYGLDMSEWNRYITLGKEKGDWSY